MDGQGDRHLGELMAAVGRDVVLVGPVLPEGPAYRAGPDPEQAGGAHLLDRQGDEWPDGIGLAFDLDEVVDDGDYESGLG